MQTEIERFLESPALSPATRRAYGVDVRQFARWLERRGTRLQDVDVRALADYAAELGRARPEKLAPATIGRKLAAVRAFLRHALGPENVPDASFAPRRPRRLPDAPRPEEVDVVLDGLAGDGPLPARNRALVELVYSAGLRSQEAVDLDLADVDFEQELVHVRGKGGKERVVPLGEEAALRLAQYLRAPSAPAPARLRDAPARRRRRPAHDPGAARAQLALDHADVQPRGRRSPSPRLRQVTPAVLSLRA